MSSKVKVTLGIFFSLSAFLIFFIIYSYYTLHKALPQYSGNIEAKGINDKIEIYRDSLGIPYIFSKDEEDAAYALGYVHAQERLFNAPCRRGKTK